MLVSVCENNCKSKSLDYVKKHSPISTTTIICITTIIATTVAVITTTSIALILTHCVEHITYRVQFQIDIITY